MTDATPSWMSALQRCLEQGSADPVLIVHLDEVLSWRLNGTSWENSKKASFEVFLDQLLIANPNNYTELFAQGLTKAQAKKRYRKLIGLFHPDRGAQDPAWLTYRAERINTAYSQFRETHHTKDKHASTQSLESGVASVGTLSTKTIAKEKPKAKRRVILPFSARDVRKWLGSPEKFEKQVFIALIALATFIVALLLLSAAVS